MASSTCLGEPVEAFMEVDQISPENAPPPSAPKGLPGRSLLLSFGGHAVEFLLEYPFIRSAAFSPGPVPVALDIGIPITVAATAVRGAFTAHSHPAGWGAEALRRTGGAASAEPGALQLLTTCEQCSSCISCWCIGSCEYFQGDCMCCESCSSCGTCGSCNTCSSCCG